jgi:hypothetical protein
MADLPPLKNAPPVPDNGNKVSHVDAEAKPAEK